MQLQTSYAVTERGLMSQEKLREHILKMSHSEVWDVAVREWFLDSIFIADEAQTCPCGQFPIKEICVLSNRLNYNSTEVGNVCVQKFLKLPSKKLFKSVGVVSEDRLASLSIEMLELAVKNWQVTNWEYEFYSDIRRKRNLSDKQAEIKRRINNKILGSLVRGKLK